MINYSERATGKGPVRRCGASSLESRGLWPWPLCACHAPLITTLTFDL
jgi:hypothetical protein